MTTILEFKELLKQIYAKYDIYIIPVLKFILALWVFLSLNRTIGFMVQLRNPVISIVLALLCSFLPVGVCVIFAGLILVAQAYALSMEVCAVTAGILLVIGLLYFRFSAKLAYVLLLTPLAFVTGIPCVIPLTMGLLETPVAAVPAAFGVVLYYLMHYMHLNSNSLGSAEADTAVTKVTSLLDSLVTNREMLLVIIAFVITVLIVYLIRRSAIDYSWNIAIAAGSIVFLFIHLAGGLVLGVNLSIVSLILGTVISMLIGFVLQFFVFSVDYTRTDRVQFEDDEYYYYVKAVPKNTIAAPEKRVTKINSQKKQARQPRQKSGRAERETKN